MMEIARSHLPSNDWLKQRLTAIVNINNSCNAWYNGEFIAFYRSGNGCGNTGELASIINHEWGHGLDHRDLVYGVSKPSGEGIADIYGALKSNDSCVGRGFFTSGSGCTGKYYVANTVMVNEGERYSTDCQCHHFFNRCS